MGSTLSLVPCFSQTRKIWDGAEKERHLIDAEGLIPVVLMHGEGSPGTSKKVWEILAGEAKRRGGFGAELRDAVNGDTIVEVADSAVEGRRAGLPRVVMLLVIVVELNEEKEDLEAMRKVVGEYAKLFPKVPICLACVGSLSSFSLIGAPEERQVNINLVSGLEGVMVGVEAREATSSFSFQDISERLLPARTMSTVGSGSSAEVDAEDQAEIEKQMDKIVSFLEQQGICPGSEGILFRFHVDPYLPNKAMDMLINVLNYVVLIDTLRKFGFI